MLTATTSSEAITVFMERVVEDRLDDVQQCRLYDAIAHGRYAQRTSLVAPGFWYPGSSNGQGTVQIVPQLFLQSCEFRQHVL